MQSVDVLLDGDSMHPGKRAKITAQDSSNKKMNVYIWDMYETLILLKSLLNGTYAEGFNGSKDVQKGIDIGKMWEKHILQICDDHFFYEQIENYNKPLLDSLREYDDGKDLSDYDFSKDGVSSPHDDLNKKKLAYWHRIIGHKYEQGLRNVIDQDTMKQLDDLYELTDSYTDRWLSSVYSSWDVGKPKCFSWIKDRFNGPNVQFCVIGDGWEECEAAQIMKWPLVQIGHRPSGSHRFPGLTLKTVGYYISVIYEPSNSESDEK
ncbi:eyes absent homolog isoform X1 [Papaver somniferum]|uniref:eyes absent homolog isoform X1 n=1 Tax=Papaver somniferum TaxID=3469 RepID=UPI000E702CAB|nr:eyes absent homolog isoform X1 [Papaver somniferum]XP_026401594.1 eyes absent homolog isoform X1 [Papaver somniferum]